MLIIFNAVTFFLVLLEVNVVVVVVDVGYTFLKLEKKNRQILIKYLLVMCMLSGWIQNGQF
jgi:hypothetical protein